ncbi:hypothetical protein [Phytomonospora endophytica]|nr:hypothetical protein [Phytomonospora endophytica]
MPARRFRVLFVLVLVLSGCGRPSSPAVDAPVDFWVVVEADGDLSPTLDGGRVFAASGTEGLLIGADFSLQQRVVSVTRDIDAVEASAYGLRGPLHAPAGHEFVLTQVATQRCSDWGGNAAGLASEVVVGERVIVLDDPLECGDLLAVVAPVGVAVTLSVTTEGRGQGLNLRDGTRVGEIPEFYGFAEYVAFAESYEQSGDVTAKGVTRDVSLSLTFSAAARGPWDRHGERWAGDGRVWLRFAVTCSSDAYWGFSPEVSKHEPAVEWRLSAADSYSLVVGGETVAPANDDVDDLSDRSGEGVTCAGPVFGIPATAEGATLRVHPDGPMRAVWSDATAATKWSKGPPPAEYAVTFAPL